MKLGSICKMLAGASLAFMLVTAPGFARERHHKDEQKKESQYPNATRKEPKLDLTKQKDSETLNKGLNAVNAGDDAQAQQILQPLADGSATKSKYAQALALQGLANLKYNAGDVKGAIDLLSKSLDIGVMPNDTYFQLKYELAQFYLADQQYQKAVDTVEAWRNEGKRETGDSYALEGNAYYRLGQYQKAIDAMKKALASGEQPKDSWNQILAASYAETGQTDEAVKLAKDQLAKNPNDATTIHNTVSMLVQAQRYSEAIQMLEDAKAKGALKDEKDYVMLAKLYLIAGQNSDDPKPNAVKAAALLEEGLSQGVIKPGYDVYKLEGDAAYMADQTGKAIAAYEKAAPFAKDGEADLRRAQLLVNDHKYTQAKKALHDAISKGVKHQGSAYMLLAEAERATKNKTAAVAAMKKAAQDPETRAKAQDWLRKAGK